MWDKLQFSGDFSYLNSYKKWDKVELKTHGSSKAISCSIYVNGLFVICSPLKQADITSVFFVHNYVPSDGSDRLEAHLTNMRQNEVFHILKFRNATEKEGFYFFYSENMTKISPIFPNFLKNSFKDDPIDVTYVIQGNNKGPILGKLSIEYYADSRNSYLNIDSNKIPIDSSLYVTMANASKFFAERTLSYSFELYTNNGKSPIVSVLMKSNCEEVAKMVLKLHYIIESSRGKSKVTDTADESSKPKSENSKVRGRSRPITLPPPKDLILPIAPEIPQIEVVTVVEPTKVPEIVEIKQEEPLQEVVTSSEPTKPDSNSIKKPHRHKVISANAIPVVDPSTNDVVIVQSKPITKEPIIIEEVVDVITPSEPQRKRGYIRTERPKKDIVEDINVAPQDSKSKDEPKKQETVLKNEMPQKLEKVLHEMKSLNKPEVLTLPDFTTLSSRIIDISFDINQDSMNRQIDTIFSDSLDQIVINGLDDFQEQTIDAIISQYQTKDYLIGESEFEDFILNHSNSHSICSTIFRNELDNLMISILTLKEGYIHDESLCKSFVFLISSLLLNGLKNFNDIRSPAPLFEALRELSGKIPSLDIVISKAIETESRNQSNQPFALSLGLIEKDCLLPLLFECYHNSLWVEKYYYTSSMIANRNELSSSIIPLIRKLVFSFQFNTDIRINVEQYQDKISSLCYIPPFFYQEFERTLYSNLNQPENIVELMKRTLMLGLKSEGILMMKNVRDPWKFVTNTLSNPINNANWQLFSQTISEIQSSKSSDKLKDFIQIGIQKKALHYWFYFLILSKNQIEEFYQQAAPMADRSISSRLLKSLIIMINSK